MSVGEPAGRRQLGRRIAVISPHLDDAVFSLGGWIFDSARAGADVAVVTVFAGDPGSVAPAADWDRRAGFSTAGEAARIRREEDRAAVGCVGGRPIWLLFDEADPDPASDDEIWATVLGAVGNADLLLVPGYPLRHAAHARLARMALERISGHPSIELYVEQPYAVWERGGGPTDTSLGSAPRVAWRVLRATPNGRRAKAKAVRAYRSQIRLLSSKISVLWKVRRYERRRGGETLGEILE